MRRLGFAIALVSAGALAYEVLLIRLFSIVEWHHLAFLIISVALLGYGASGTLLALARERLFRNFEVAAATASAGFGATSIGAFLIAQRVELNSLEIFWSTRQLGWLFLLYLLFAVPFFCAATAIGLALSRFAAESPRLYRADLLGGGVSAAAMTALLFVVHPVTALQLVACTGFVAAAAVSCRAQSRHPLHEESGHPQHEESGHPPHEESRHPLHEGGPSTSLGMTGVAVLGVIAVIAVRPLALPLRMSQFKELSHALRIPEARVVAERSSPLAMLTAVASPAVPFRHAPGLSLGFTGEIPEQIGVFSDGGGMTPIVRGPSRDYLDWLPTAVAYHLGAPKRQVAIIGAGGGVEVLNALTHGAERVTAVELNPQMVELANGYKNPRVRVVRAEARQFIRRSDERFDAIQIALVGSHGASAAGVQALSESYLYTVEAMRELLAHLTPNGHLVITRWMQAPPREVVKLIATATEVTPHIAVFRGWNTATVIVKNRAFDANEVSALRAFCDDRSFDLDFAPGVTREETNQINVLDEPYLFDAATMLLRGEREQLFDRYKFNIRPATDERPYFFHSFKWSTLPELLRMRARGGVPLLEWGYLVLIIGLAQALIAAMVLILLPLFAMRRARPKARLFAYFGSIGLAFLFVEIAFMQRLTLFLGHPLYAIAIVLASFLVFGGLGSGASARFTDRRVALIVAGIAIIELLIVRALTAAAVGLPDALKIVIAIALVAPLAFVMGMPFPRGLSKLADSDPEAIPWAWGINGTASVLASMLATLISVHFGFSMLVLCAAALYALADAAARP